MRDAEYLSRAAARRVQCPECFAPPEQPCVAASGEDRASCHKERHIAARRFRARERKVT